MAIIENVLGRKAGQLDLWIQQGATFDHVLKFTSGGAPINLTGYTARAQIRSGVSSSDVVLDISTNNGRFTNGGINGQIAFALTDIVTAALAPGEYVWDMQLVSSGGTVTRWLKGKVTVDAEVTR